MISIPCKVIRYENNLHFIVAILHNYMLVLQVDGQLTLGENIADNGGVHTAFQAYKNVMHQTGEEATSIKGYTLDQLFFVAFAQVR